MTEIRNEGGELLGYTINLGAEPPQPLPGKDHNCYDHARPYDYVENGQRFHGWECGKCGEFLQAG